MTPPEVYNPQYTQKGYFTMNKKSVTILCVFLIITGVVLFHFTTDAEDTETHAIPYPVNDFSTDTAYPVKEIGNLGNYIRIDHGRYAQGYHLDGCAGAGTVILKNS